VKAVVFYQTAEGAMDKARELFPLHKARLDAFQAQGKVLMVGPFTDAQGGAMGIYRDRAAAEEFVKEDPFMLNGVVAKCEIRDWKETLV
jgi:uncharacterized protein YciI